ncbi:MAG: gliding motility-associated C-terminal domain-containing protein [Flavobacteriales bacterium]|nr:gliding motility-associated C-terminal domain-containing protein [Flavobacteriales bacterium]
MDRRTALPLLCFTLIRVGAVQGQSALRFVENKGQWPASVTYRAEVAGAMIWCERNAIVIDRFDNKALHEQHANIHAKPPGSLKHHAVRLRFLSEQGTSCAIGGNELPDRYSYFIGNDPDAWAGNARAFSEVRIPDVAPGCDARFREGRAGLKYDLELHAGADPGAVRFTYEGASEIELRNATLIITTSLGRMTEHIPIAYQDINGRRNTVPCRYTLRDGVIGVRPGPYDTRYPLVIDPELSFATYSGSVSNNFGYTATFDASGFLYAGSTAFGASYPVTMGAYSTAWSGGATDIAITKYDTTGTFLIWSTYLGGSAAEMPHSLVVDDNDQLVLLGTTGSNDFPTSPDAFDATFGGGTNFTPSGLGLTYPQGCDMVVARLSSNGAALIGSTYLGGPANDGLNSAPGLKFNYADEVRGEVLLNDAHEVWVVSCTQSTSMPLSSNAAQPGHAGGTHDGYVARFSPALDALLYGSFIGGSGADATFSGELDGDGRLYVCGGTNSSDLDTHSGAVQSAFSGGQADAFVARFNADGSAIDALTYWGSTAYDQAYFIELDAEGAAYLFGQTSAPTGELIQNAPYNIPAGGQFITKLDHDLGTVLLSSRIGRGDGTPDISPTAFLVDVCDKIYTSGWGSSNEGLGGALSTTGLPVTPDAHQAQTDGQDLYLAVFDIDMNALFYATYYGGGLSPEHVDGGTSRFDRRGRVYQSVCAGCQGNSDFPTTPGAWSATNNSGGCNNGLLKFDFDAPLVIAAFTAPDTICGPNNVQFTNLSSGAASYLWDFGDGTSSTAASPAHAFPGPGSYLITLTASHPEACNGQDQHTRTIRIHPPAPVLVVTGDTLLCGPLDTFTLLANSGGTATDFHWSASPRFTDMLNASPGDSTAVLSPPVTGTYYVRGSNDSPCVARDSVFLSVSNASVWLYGDSLICARDTARLVVSGADPGSVFQWSPADAIISGQGTAQVTVSPPDPTVYGVTITTPSGCTWSGSVGVLVSTIDGGSISAGADETLVLPGTAVQLHAAPSTGVDLLWTPGQGLSDPTIADPIATVHTTTTYSVTISDGICTRSASVTIRVHDLVCDEPDIFVPNTFTPNNDGNNDRLYVRGRSIERMEFQVFDRWGEKVFESTDPAVGWDGTFEGRPVDPAVFVYHLTAWCIDGQRFFKKGNVTVVR